MGADESSSSHHRHRSDRDGHRSRSHRDHQPDSTSHRSSRRDETSSSSSHRRRSLSPPSRNPTQSEEPHPTLTRFQVPSLAEEDYFIRATEFKSWLAESKGKYLDEISSSSARQYFSRFVRRWNDGRLPEEYYNGTIRSSAAAGGSSSQTRHRWAFTTKAGYSKAEEEQLTMVRDNVDTLTNGNSAGAREAREAKRRSRKGGRDGIVDGVDAEEDKPRDAGWSSARNSRAVEPSTSASASSNYAESQFDREHRSYLERVARTEARRRERQDERDADEALHGGRASGRDRMLEKKRERAAVNRDFANRRSTDDGIEMDERDLYDEPLAPHAGSSSRRGDERRSEAAKGLSKREQARQERLEERKAEMQDKFTALKEKDKATMEMFKAMAKDRFGGA